MKKRTSQEFCLSLLGLSVLYRRALSNVVMSLAGDTLAEVSVSLSLCRLFHYQYSSLSKVVTNISKDVERYKKISGEIVKLQCFYLRDSLEDRIRLITDCTPIVKRHSDCLSGRQYIAVPNNKILDNKPIDVGYLVSSTQLNFSDKWCVPLSQKRVELANNSLDVGVSQLRDLLKLSLFDKQQLIINTADSAYGTPRFLSPLYDCNRLVNVVRLRAGMKVCTEDRRTETGGANHVYGEVYYLNPETQDKIYTVKGKAYEVHQTSIYDLAPAETQTIEAQTNKGRAITITLTRWNNLLRRAKKPFSMKEKPIDLISVSVKDRKTGKPIFKAPLYITISGKQKDAVSTIEAYYDYYHRFDIEHNFRFQKQHLLLQNYQTPDCQTFDNWLLVVQLANTLLFLAADEVEHTCQKWQQYNDKPNKSNQRLTPCQTKKAAQNLFCTFDEKPFLPQNSKKGKGRLKGTTFTHRTPQKVSKKPKLKPQKTG